MRFPQLTSIGVFYLMMFYIMAKTPAAFAQALFDDFNGKKLDRSVWKKANRKWGAHRSGIGHGGVVSANVFIKGGNLVLRANGDLYTGPIKGVGQSQRVGGAISTIRRFASGRYEIRAKTLPRLGALSAFWTFHYSNDSVNHEIDLEIPGKDSLGKYDLNWGLLTNWRGLSEESHRSVNKHLGRLTDGDYHVYRFDWYAGSEIEAGKVEWYVDGTLIHTEHEVVPTIPSNFWLGVWFPWWIGPARFYTDYMFIDWVRITPFVDLVDKVGGK